MAITSQSDFYATFGIAKSGNIDITYPSFSGQTVVACVGQPSAGKELHVYCTTTQNSGQLKDTAAPVAITTVPKVLNVKKIILYANGEKVMTKAVEFDNRETKEVNVVNDNSKTDVKPVVLKRTMRRPAVI